MSQVMSISQLYRTAKCVESIENWARADEPLLSEVPSPADTERRSRSDSGWDYRSRISYEIDEQFWMLLLNASSERDRSDINYTSLWDKSFHFGAMALSEWIPRVPGLFWRSDSISLRSRAERHVQYRRAYGTVYSPLGKSMHVMGGIGTLKLPPDGQGRHLVCLSSGTNASSGIPAIIYPDVWDRFALTEGSVLLRFTAKWQQMDTSWAERFPSIRGIPKGYLVIDHEEQIDERRERTAPIAIHPFSVMQYSKASAILFDYVYVTADSSDSTFRSATERFFKEYSRIHDRYGEYLISADVNDPLWDARFDNPAALRSSAPIAGSMLDFIESRIRELSFHNHNLEQLLECLVSYYDLDGLQRLSNQIGVPHAIWFAGGTIAQASAQLLQLCIERSKVEELLDMVALDDPNLLLSIDEAHI